MTPAPGTLPISAVIPAYGAEAHIAAAIESASRQSPAPAEIIVVDDASGDRTGAIATAMGARLISFARNAGQSAARNAGVTAATQPWVAFLDADDVWLPGKLAAQWDALRRWPDAALCFTDFDVVYTGGEVVQRALTAGSAYRTIHASERLGDAVRFPPGSIARGLLRSQAMFVRQSSIIVNRALFLAGGGYDERLRMAEDYEFFLRFLGAAPAVAVERVLVAYRRQPDSLSADPLKEVSATDRLLAAMLAAPDRYPNLPPDLIARSRCAMQQSGCTRALRVGRFGEAATFASAALTFERPPVALALLALAHALDNRAGEAAYRIAQTLWRTAKVRIRFND